MARTPINPALIHRKSDADRSAVELRPVVQALLAELRPLVEEGLRREITGYGVAAWANEARAALGMAIRDEVGDNDVDHLRAKLTQALQKPLDASKEEVDAQSAELANLMATAWVQFLDLALGARPSLDLTKELLPSKGAASDDLWRRLRASLATSVLATDDATRVMGKAAGRLFAQQPKLALPLGLLIERNGQQFLARRRNT